MNIDYDKKNNFKKYIIYGIILFIVILTLIGLQKVITPSISHQIKKELISMGFKEGEIEDLIVKQEDDKTYTFSLGDYTYNLERNNNDDSVEKTLTATYNFKYDIINYSYRVYYSDFVNVYFKGTYQNEKFTCDKEFSSTSLSNEEINNICSLVKIDIELFDLEAKTLFSKYKYIDYIKNR